MSSTSSLYVGNGNRRPVLGVPSGRSAVPASAYRSAIPDDTPASVALRYHSADTDRDWRITLPELNRVTDLYNTQYLTIRTGAYKVDQSTVDGFAPDPDRPPGVVAKLDQYHSADYNRDGCIGFDELLRVIEIYNYRVSGGIRLGLYHPWDPLRDRTPEPIDGFELGPAPN